ncbi:MAG: DUF512 domain-containing protein, partial [Anaerofustis stercorihominis]|nr:DUF512 domain-containing protein [Anaerofustis stercorihominis]
MRKTVTYCAENSIGKMLGITAGDEIIRINGKSDFDIIDYFCAQAEDILEIEYKKSGETETVVKSIKNDEYLPIGLSFEQSTIDNPKRCANKCIFCFMDQMPDGVRDTLIFKDDDYRLSFTDGNYITLTNVSDAELQRIVDLRLSPMNISVHTTSPLLREKMLNNKKAGKILEQLRTLSNGGIDFNLQLVLCPGYNDKDELRRTLSDLIEFLPNIISLSAVPVGLTKYREKLTVLKPFTKEEAADVIDIIDEFRKKAEEICGDGIFCASDE